MVETDSTPPIPVDMGIALDNSETDPMNACIFSELCGGYNISVIPLQGLSPAYLPSWKKQVGLLPWPLCSEMWELHLPTPFLLQLPLSLKLVHKRKRTLQVSPLHIYPN